MKARSKSAKNRGTGNRNRQNRRVRRKPLNTAVVPVAVNGSPNAGKAVIPITTATGPNGNKLVPVAVRRASGEVVIPAQVRQRGRGKRTVAISVAVSRPKRQVREQSMKSARRLRQRDPITNALVTATRIEENAVTLAAQIGITALEVLEHWSRFLLKRGVRVAKATERGMMGQAVRALDIPLVRPMIEVEFHSPEAQEFRRAA